MTPWWTAGGARIFPYALPPDPDADQAREWVNQELSKPGYGDQITWLTRVIRNVLQWIDGIFNRTGVPSSLRGFVIGGIVVLVLIVLGIIVWRNPITRRARSQGIFEQDTSLADAQANAEHARQAGDWSQAFIWTFRVMVLAMAQRDVCSAGPGVTANEASRAISTRLGFSSELSQAALQFDQVRYGDGVPDVTDVERLASLNDTLQNVVDQVRTSPEATSASCVGVPATQAGASTIGTPADGLSATSQTGRQP